MARTETLLPGVGFLTPCIPTSAPPLSTSILVAHIQIGLTLLLVDEPSFKHLAVDHLSDIEATDCGVVVRIRHHALVIARVVQRKDQRRRISRIEIEVGRDQLGRWYLLQFPQGGRLEKWQELRHRCESILVFWYQRASN